MRSVRVLWASLLTISAVSLAANGQVVISQANGNGGLAGDTYDRDFVELFNKGTTTVDLTGWSLLMFDDIGGATTPATPVWDTLPLSGTIDPGQYRLIVPVLTRGGLTQAFSLPPLPPADQMATEGTDNNLNSIGNAVALMSSVVFLADGECPTSHPDFVDLFRYGRANALCFEGTGPAVGPTTGVRAAIRLDDGCVDTNDSAADIVTGQFPNPRNASTNAFVSSTVFPISVTNGFAELVTLTVTRGLSPCNPLPAGNLSAVSADLTAFGLSNNETLFDDGAHGDGGADDGIYGITFVVAADQATGRYDIPVVATGNAGVMVLDSEAILRVFPTPATNDSCFDAIPLSGTGPVLYSDILNTTQALPDQDAGTCNGDAEVKYSIWFSYTHPTGGAIRVEETSSEDVVASIHTDCAGVSIACQRAESGAFIPMEAGVPLLIQIGQETGALEAPQVPLELSIHYEPAPVNDDPCGAIAIPLDAPFHTTPNAAATAPLEPGLNISCDQGTNPPEARRGVWYTISTTDAGLLVFTEGSANFSVVSALLAESCAGPFTEVACDSESSGGGAVFLDANTSYFVLVSLSTFSVVPFEPYDITFEFFPAPANDLCTGAVDLNVTGVPYSETVINAFAAGGDPGVPTSTTSGFNACNATLGTRPNGVWYKYTAAPDADGMLWVAESTANDVFYNVFTGGEDCTAGLTADQCYGQFTNDDIFIRLVPNTTYYILMGMQSTSASAIGDYQVSFTPIETPVNDEPCGAISVSETPFNFVPPGPAYHEDVDVSCNYEIPAQFTTGYGGWYHFNLPTDRLLRADERQTDVCVFGLFTGPDCNNLTEIDCKMGSNGDLFGLNAAWFNLQANTDYWLLIGRISNSQPFGFFDIQIDLFDAPGACCEGSDCTIDTAIHCGGQFTSFATCAETPQYENLAPQAIPDASTANGAGVITSTIDVADVGLVTDLKVLIDINHARVGDLIITVTGPTGAQQDLIRRIDDQDGGCPAFNVQGRLTDLGGVYIFDDQGYDPYGPTMPAAAKYFDFTGLVVPSGHYQPTTCNDVLVSLNQGFFATPTNGTWTLEVRDEDVGSTGTLNRWGLIINYGADPTCSCAGDLDGDGDYNGLDIQPFVDCVIDGIGEACECADLSGNGTPGIEDVELFVDLLIDG